MYRRCPLPSKHDGAKYTQDEYPSLGVTVKRARAILTFAYIYDDAVTIL